MGVRNFRVNVFGVSPLGKNIWHQSVGLFHLFPFISGLLPHSLTTYRSKWDKPQTRKVGACTGYPTAGGSNMFKPSAAIESICIVCQGDFGMYHD